MNHCAFKQNAYEMRSSVSSLVCPKPRRFSLLNSTITDHQHTPTRPVRWHQSHLSEPCDAKAGSDLLDIILTKGGDFMEQTHTQVASSPPFFTGSPPSRVANPLIQDARFKDEKFSPFSPQSPIPTPSGHSGSPSSSARKGSCVRVNFGNKPSVRIEGFDCLDRDSRNCSIPALA